jgi:penicillin amidase
VELTRDTAGVVHIRAGSEHDLFFAQGYSAARDRLFQFELFRLQATGTLAKALGPRHVPRDTAARLLRYRGDMKAELAHYHPRGRAIVEAFVAGVNAAVDEANAAPERLPPEFGLLGLRPGRWTPEVVVSRHGALSGNLPQELDLSRAVHLLGAGEVERVLHLEPGPVALAKDAAALDLGAIDAAAVGAGFKLWRSPVAFTAEDLATPPSPGAAPTPLPQAPGREPGGADGGEEGSNNWVVAGSRTASGKPLLANDPHRAMRLPSLRYWVHLTAPGWDVVGGGEPTLPGVSIGHNAHGAWGLTVFSLDAEDLYVYETHPDDPRLYRYGKTWERMREERETVEVRGGAPVPVTLRFTRHGPVLHEDPKGRRAYALRAAWLAPGGAPYLASLRMDQARTWEEFRRAVGKNHLPALNYVWADRQGHIGWQVAGVAPVRRGWSGLLPVPGDGRYEWSGTLPVLSLPHQVDPPGGLIATANENNVPRGYAHPGAVGKTWAAPWRVERLREALGGKTRGLTADDQLLLQQDVLSLPSRALLPLLRTLPLTEPRAVRAREVLLAAEGLAAEGGAARRFPGAGLELRADSAAAAVYVAWERRLVRDVAEKALPEEVRPLLGREGVPLRRTLEWLTRPESAPERVFGAQASGRAQARDALLAASFTGAVEDLAAKLGPDVAAWRYGDARFKHVRLAHPLTPALPKATADALRLDVGPLPRGGDANTVNVTGAEDNQNHGASFRFIADLSDWDNSLGTNTPGQSGDPRSPHYADLFAPWAEGRAFRVPFTRQAVLEAAESVEVRVP